MGLPLTILKIREEHEVAVVRWVYPDFGEMTRLAKIARAGCLRNDEHRTLPSGKSEIP